ncbi:MAG: glycosyltransferase family 2 protein [Planctomycetota bacterium]
MAQINRKSKSKIARLTIVVPRGEASEDAFETSLVSVLQHRPASCEVIVPHDGSYDDPFDLSDEVEFLGVDSDRLLTQIHAAANVAHGRFVHVVARGHAVTAGWCDAALSMFERWDAGIVSPVVRDADGFVNHAGWRHGPSSACYLIGHDDSELRLDEAAHVDGAFLDCAFWRRDLLRSLEGAYVGYDPIEASVAYAFASGRADWRCVVAPECEIQSGEPNVIDHVRAHQRSLQAISNHYQGGGWNRGLSRLISSILGRQGGLSVGMARAMAPLIQASTERKLCDVDVTRLDSIIEGVRRVHIPSKDNRTYRRAA